MFFGKKKAKKKCSYCTKQRTISCGHCDEGSCKKEEHTYQKFFTKRYGTDNDQIGSKFFYICGDCEKSLCVDCLGIREVYPCDEADVEIYPFACPICEGRVNVFRCDQKSYWEAVSEMKTYLEAPSQGDGLRVAFEQQHSKEEVVEPQKMGGLVLGPRPRALWPGEIWETAIHLKKDEGTLATIFLGRSEQGGLRNRLYTLENGKRKYLSDIPHKTLWHSEKIFELTNDNAFQDQPFTIIIESDNLGVSNLSQSKKLVLERIGIARYPEMDDWPLSVFGQEDGGLDQMQQYLQESMDRIQNISTEMNEENIASFTNELESMRDVLKNFIGEMDERQEKEKKTSETAALLKKLTDKKIWDYEWIECPPTDQRDGSQALVLAGSTDLIYYQLVRVHFMGVRYMDCWNYFSHPYFRLATEMERKQVESLVEFGPESQVFAITKDFGGGIFEGGSFVVADSVHVEWEKECESDFKPHNPDNTSWWYNKD